MKRVSLSQDEPIVVSTTAPERHIGALEVLARLREETVRQLSKLSVKGYDLHPDEIEIEAESSTKVGFVPFMGISPFRYCDIFQKGRRKSEDGKAKSWLRGEPVPMIDFVLPTYTYSEDWALADLIGHLEAVPTQVIVDPSPRD